MILKAIKAEVQRLADPQRVKDLSRYFKLGPGQYGQGDTFVGLSAPQCRSIAKDHKKVTLEELSELIQSPIHEQRSIAIHCMVTKYKSKQQDEKQSVYWLYLNSMKYINNWDFVDVSAPHIVGAYLLQKSQEKSEAKKIQESTQILYKWAQDANLWVRRVSIISTFAFIRVNQFQHTLKISQKLLSDKEDLIHKATGWMLRQVSKRDQEILEKFIRSHYKEIPRTALRYAIEKFEEKKRKRFLMGDLGSQ